MGYIEECLNVFRTDEVDKGISNVTIILEINSQI
jgi:hypothetical protein